MSRLGPRGTDRMRARPSEHPTEVLKGPQWLYQQGWPEGAGSSSTAPRTAPGGGPTNLGFTNRSPSPPGSDLGGP